MTCQVVLLNAWGVALASDSAVTSGSRVMNGSEKVFELSLPHKIAVLTSSNARLMDYPWESIFSGWSDSLTKPLASVADYWESLTDWLRTSVTKQGELSESEFNYLENEVYSAVSRDLYHEVWIPFLGPFFESNLSSDDIRIANSNHWSDDFRTMASELLTEEIVQKCNKAIDELIQRRMTVQKLAQNTSLGQSEVWIEKYFEKFEKRFTRDFQSEILLGYPEIQGFRKLLEQMAITYLAYPDRDSATWICMVGFGEKDLVPSGLEREVHGVVSGSLLLGDGSTGGPVTSYGYAWFGQTDAIRSLVEGQDALLMTATSRVNERLSQARAQLPDVDDEVAARIRDVYEAAFSSSNLQEEVVNAGREQRLIPFQRAVQMSPVIDLAEFAGTLVGVQAASAAFTQDNPTVGGPIDVAIITRRHGFQWIRKKGQRE